MLPGSVNVESLRFLLEFIEVLKNPEKMKKEYENLKETIKAYDNVMAVYPTVKEADKYLNQARLQIAEYQKEIDTKYAKLEKDIADSQKKQDEQRDEINSLFSQARDEKEVLAEKKVALEKKQEVLASKENELNTLKKTLSEKEKELTQKEQELLDKTQKLKAMFG